MSRIEKYINKNLTLVSNDCMGMYELSSYGIDAAEYDITKDDAKEAIVFMIEHFKNRCLTSDEADAIARLI